MDDEKPSHPYLSGNFAPIRTSFPLTPCPFEGTIPVDLAGGEYVRNGGNPLINQDLGRDAHWFDGDGMLTGVLFRRVMDDQGRDAIVPEFVNQFLLTDVYCYAIGNPFLRRPILPSIATLINPINSVLASILAVLRTMLIVALSRLPGRPTIRKISVANTNVLYHDGRALATCESGPPLRFALPGLETIGWFNGRGAENEKKTIASEGSGFGGTGPMSAMREWTTAHPRVDPITKELIAFHSTFARPFVRYSIVKPSKPTDPGSSSFDEPIPGVESPKMMHDFGVSSHHTVIMDLPLTLDPRNNLRGIPSLHYDSAGRSRFGVFPRYEPRLVQWFETTPCLIFHTANCWDTASPATKSSPPETTVHLLACRLNTAATIFNAGNLAIPQHEPTPPEYTEEKQSRLYYYSFPLAACSGDRGPCIRHQWALSAIPFEFPTIPADMSMRECQYIYGCSTSGSFTAALGKTAKIDHLAKIDARSLIAKGIAQPPRPIKGHVDNRTVEQVVESSDPDDPIKLFSMPAGWYAQEPRFVARSDAKMEDDGWLLFYAFDESQLDTSGGCPVEAKSELWIVDAHTMEDIVARILLPQRVPYGLHGNWFSEEQIRGQQPFDTVKSLTTDAQRDGLLENLGSKLESWIG